MSDRNSNRIFVLLPLRHLATLREKAHTMASKDGNLDWATWAFSPSISAILVTLIVSLSLPILIHYYLYKTASPKQLPTVLLIGPSGAGKTTLLTLVTYSLSQHCHSALTPLVVLQRRPSTNPYLPITPVRPLPAPLLNPFLRRPLPLRERHFFPRPAQVPPPRHARPRQAPSPRKCHARLARESERDRIRSGQRSSELSNRPDRSSRVPT